MAVTPPSVINALIVPILFYFFHVYDLVLMLPSDSQDHDRVLEQWPETAPYFQFINPQRGDCAWLHGQMSSVAPSTLSPLGVDSQVLTGQWQCFVCVYRSGAAWSLCVFISIGTRLSV